MMDNNPLFPDYELLCVIVDFGDGSKVLRIAQSAGVPDGTIFLGTGTAKNKILQFLELTDIRKELVLLITESDHVDTLIASIDDEMELRKPYHGIAFSMPLSNLIWQEKLSYENHQYGGHSVYHSIFAIVGMDKSEEVMDAATKAGARGGTVIKARGAGSGETGRLFQMEIQPEREIVIILSEASATEKIVNAIRDRLDIANNGDSIIFCNEVTKTCGVS